MKSRFIVFEGPDGAGTTLHSKLLAEALQASGIDVFLTAEPTQGPIGTFVREQLREGSPLSPGALQHLFTADRSWHIESEIAPALAAGKTVICDRYVPSTLIYGSALGEPSHMLQEMNNYFIQPDVLFILLPPYEVCAERMARRKERDRLENGELQRKVYDGYRKCAREHPKAIVIDTSGEKQQVSAAIRSHAEKP